EDAEAPERPCRVTRHVQARSERRRRRLAFDHIGDDTPPFERHSETETGDTTTDDEYFHGSLGALVSFGAALEIAITPRELAGVSVPEPFEAECRRTRAVPGSAAGPCR